MRQFSRFPWRRVLLIALVWSAALRYAASQDWRLWDAPAAAPAPAVQPDAAVWFTDPPAARAQGFQGGPIAALTEAVDAARLSVDVAVYSLDYWPLRAALTRAAGRGVRVRLVLEADNADSADVRALQQAGIPLRVDDQDGLMHHKFAIVDGREVWSGSMNFTFESAYQDDNNLLRLRNPRLTADFRREFEEMFVRGLFGPHSRADTPFPEFSWQTGAGAVYFSPDDGALARLLEAAGAAQSEICFLAFSFTSDALGDLLLARSGQGVLVRGVFDAGQARSNRGSEYPRLRAAGLDVRLDGGAGRMHHKVLVLDGKTVVAGSYNFSRSAEERNDETLLILHSPELAAAYQAECERLLAEAR